MFDFSKLNTNNSLSLSRALQGDETKLFDFFEHTNLLSDVVSAPPVLSLNEISIPDVYKNYETLSSAGKKKAIKTILSTIKKGHKFDPDELEGDQADRYEGLLDIFQYEECDIDNPAFNQVIATQMFVAGVTDICSYLAVLALRSNDYSSSSEQIFNYITWIYRGAIFHDSKSLILLAMLHYEGQAVFESEELARELLILSCEYAREQSMVLFARFAYQAKDSMLYKVFGTYMLPKIVSYIKDIDAFGAEDDENEALGYLKLIYGIQLERGDFFPKNKENAITCYERAILQIPLAKVLLARLYAEKGNEWSSTYIDNALRCCHEMYLNSHYFSVVSRDLICDYKEILLEVFKILTKDLSNKSSEDFELIKDIAEQEVNKNPKVFAPVLAKYYKYRYEEFNDAIAGKRIVKYLNMSCKADVESAKQELAYIYFNGIGSSVKVDYKQAYLLGKEINSLDPAKFSYELALMTDKGLGTKEDPYAAFSMIKQIYDEDYNNAKTSAQICLELALRYNQGRGVTKDLQIANSFFSRAAKLGSKVAQLYEILLCTKSCLVQEQFQELFDVISLFNTKQEDISQVAKTVEQNSKKSKAKQGKKNKSKDTSSSKVKTLFPKTAECTPLDIDNYENIIPLLDYGYISSPQVLDQNNQIVTDYDLENLANYTIKQDDELVLKEFETESYKLYIKDLLNTLRSKKFAPAHYILAVLLEHKFFGKVSDIEVFNTYQEAANANITSACKKVADCYAQGIYTKPNRKRAISFYKKAADNGNMQAKILLGELYLQEDSEDNLQLRNENYADALSMLGQAASETNNVRALFLMGTIYLNGLGVNIDKRKALSFFERAAQQNYEEAYRFIGEIYYVGQGIAQDLKKSRYYFEKLAFINNSKYFDIQNLLADMYMHAIGGTQEEDKALELLNFLSQHNDLLSKVRLCKLILDSENKSEQNIQDAVDYCEQVKQCYTERVKQLKSKALASKKNDTSTNILEINNNLRHNEGLLSFSENMAFALACNQLGYIYEQGICVDVDLKRAFKNYKEAASIKDCDGLYELGRCYQGGIGTNIDLVKAFQSYSKAAEVKHSKALLALANLKLEKPSIERAALARDLAEKEQLEKIQAKKEASSLAESKSHKNVTEQAKANDSVDDAVVPISETDAVQFLEQAAQTGEAEAQFKLAQLYQKGELVDQDLEKAVRWYERAAKQKHAEACFILSKFYLTGTIVKHDAENALMLLKNAADKNYVQAQSTLGFMFLVGQTVPRNMELALYYLEKASLKNDANALNNLGFIYQNGMEVEPNIKLAIEYYEKAKDLGLADAFRNLGLLYMRGEQVEEDLGKGYVYLSEALRLGDIPSKLIIEYMLSKKTHDPKKIAELDRLYPSEEM